MRLLIGLTALLGMNFNAQAEDGPTYNQTIDFIKEHTSVVIEKRAKDIYTSDFPEKCVFTYKNEHFEGGKKMYESIIKIDFAQLSNIKIYELNSHYVKIRSSGDKNRYFATFERFAASSRFESFKKALKCESDTSCVNTTSTDELQLRVEEPQSEISEKVEKAFLHLVENYCPIKKDLF